MSDKFKDDTQKQEGLTFCSGRNWAERMEQSVEENAEEIERLGKIIREDGSAKITAEELDTFDENGLPKLPQF